MHYWRRNIALQTLGIPWPAAAGPTGPAGHYFFTNNALAGILNLVAPLPLPCNDWPLRLAHFVRLAPHYMSCFLHQAFTSAGAARRRSVYGPPSPSSPSTPTSSSTPSTRHCSSRTSTSNSKTLITQKKKKRRSF